MEKVFFFYIYQCNSIFQFTIYDTAETYYTGPMYDVQAAPTLLGYKFSISYSESIILYNSFKLFTSQQNKEKEKENVRKKSKQ